MTNIEREILDNQRVILYALSIILTPKNCNVDLMIDRMRVTEKLLQEESDE